MTTALIILAAGQGTRMQSDLPKVLHQLGGAPLFAHALTAGRTLNPARTVMVVGHGGDKVADAARVIDAEIRIAVQESQRGTADAVATAGAALGDFQGDALVLYGDTPLVRPESLAAMQRARASGHAVVVLGFHSDRPGRYGRLVTSGDTLEAIVEFKDATEDERAISLCNSGVICADAGMLMQLVSGVGNDNASGEFYLTDIVGLARAQGHSAGVVICDEAETLGINTREELAAAEAVFQSRARARALSSGVTLTAPDTVHFSLDTVIGRDVLVEPNVIFGAGVTVETGARIRAFSYLEGCQVGGNAVVGPFARLRPGTELANNAKIGNFVEIKNAEIGDGAKVNHLTYIGDASVGAATNIGAGTVTCNYNGVEKFRTEIGERVFIGSDTMLIAPVKIGDAAMTASGSVITRDVPAGALSISRAEQVVKPGLSIKLFDMYKTSKQKRKSGA